MSDLVRLLRPKQWAKNALVFAALLFTGRILTGDGVVEALLAFFAMGFASSGTYVFNDLRDVQRDRAHPVKKNRPLAAGRVSIPLAITVGALLLVAGLGLAFAINVPSGTIVLLYLVLQVAYNAVLKRMAVADVFTIASGFVLRAVLSATAIEAKVSVWLLLCTATLALMLGFAKRRSEWIALGDARATSRESLAGYSLRALDGLVLLFAAGTVTTYLLYSIDSRTGRDHPSLILTAFFVTYGVCRYLLLVFSEDEGGEPADVLFGDRHMLFAVGGFLLTAGLAFILPPVPWLDR